MDLVKTIHHLAQAMTATSSPQHHALKSLRSQRGEDSFSQRRVQGKRQINIATAKMAVFGSGTKGQGRQDQGLDRMLSCCLFSGCDHQALSKPGIKINRQMRTLLLRAAKRDDRKPAQPGTVTNLLISEMP